MKQKDRNLIIPLLGAYKEGHVDKDYCVKYLLDIYSDSKIFNLFNFQIGMSVGIFIMLILNYFDLL